MRAISLDHPGYSVVFKTCCDENCEQKYDVCLNMDKDCNMDCSISLVPVCGKQSGVTALLAEVKKFIASVSAGENHSSGDFPVFLENGEIDETRVVCVGSRSGGAGTSCVSIGIGREMSRYRELMTVYICLTEIESTALLPESCSAAMKGGELLYRSLRVAGKTDGHAGFDSLIRAAFIPDEYGLLRLGVDADINALSALTPYEFSGLLSLIDSVIGPVFFVVDFGTRMRMLKEFLEICDAKTIEVERYGSGAFPECPEDVRHTSDKIDIALANTFGLKIKELCDELWA